MDCIFCKIAAKEIEAEVVHEDDELVAFNDANPKAPHHVLIIPRKHIATINDLTEEDTLLVGKMTQLAKQLAAKLNIAEAGYRILMNCNKGGGQDVFHIHLHLLGGRQLTWPPG